MELEVNRFSLREALELSLTMVKEKAMKHRIALSLEIEPNAEGEITLDERKFKQIMFNLLSNAVKFTPSGGRVTVSAGRWASPESPWPREQRLKPTFWRSAWPISA